MTNFYLFLLNWTFMADFRGWFVAENIKLSVLATSLVSRFRFATSARSAIIPGLLNVCPI